MREWVCCGVLALALALTGLGGETVRKAVFCGGSGDWELSKCCALSGKENPKLLLFCTANGDAAWSVEGAAKQGAKFTTNAEVVKLFEPEMTAAELRAKILGADVVFFYGGATEKIAERLSFWHLDDALRLAYARGTVLAGYSAGAIILSHAGLTDFPNDRYDLISGLGVVDCYFCPHYEGGRWKEFDARLDEETDESLPREAWALERGMAVVFRDGRPEVLSNNAKSHVYRFTRNDGVWTKREVPAPITAKTAVTQPADVLFKEGDLIVQTGDSITAYGRTLGLQALLPEALSALGINAKYEVYGYGGRVSEQVLDELPNQLARKPKYVLLEFGINDLNGVHGEVTWEQFAANLEKIWTMCEESGATPIQIGLCRESEGKDKDWCAKTKALCANRAKPVLYADVFAEMNAVWKDPSVPTVPGRDYTKLTNDGTHPNAAGYREMTWAVLKAIGVKEEDRAAVDALWQSRH